MIVVGMRAPPIAGRTTRGESVTLEQHRGRHVVVYFFPKAFSPGCTRQAERFTDAYEAIRALGAEIIGVSVDDYQTQCSFAEKHEVKYPLLADPGREISRAYGVLRKWLPFDRRVTFVIAPDGTVAARFAHEIRVSQHVRDVVDFLRKATAG